jgi:hypothetical protein
MVFLPFIFLIKCWSCYFFTCFFIYSQRAVHGIY